MSDLISRADAVEAVAKAKATDPFGRYDKQNIGIDWALDALSELPSADAPKPTGEFISRAEAIEAVENNSYGMGSRASLKAIKALPSAEAKWIPCSERLPSNDGCVLVSIDDGIEFGKYEDGEWSIWDCEHWDKWGSKGTIAWMPLPTPYKGGDE